jgi:uncharacterized protein YukE
VDPRIRVEPAELATLAARLSGLAGELEDEAGSCRTTAGTLADALGGGDGERAGAVASAWAELVEGLADRAGALAITLRSAAAAYQELDRTLLGPSGVLR